eukprot:9776606-Alexandrium_andersonii.AAC.1
MPPRAVEAADVGSHGRSSAVLNHFALVVGVVGPLVGLVIKLGIKDAEDEGEAILGADLRLDVEVAEE